MNIDRLVEDSTTAGKEASIAHGGATLDASDTAYPTEGRTENESSSEQKSRSEFPRICESESRVPDPEGNGLDANVTVAGTTSPVSIEVNPKTALQLHDGEVSIVVEDSSDVSPPTPAMLAATPENVGCVDNEKSECDHGLPEAAKVDIDNWDVEQIINWLYSEPGNEHIVRAVPALTNNWLRRVEKVISWLTARWWRLTQTNAPCRTKRHNAPELTKSTCILESCDMVHRTFPRQGPWESRTDEFLIRGTVITTKALPLHRKVITVRYTLDDWQTFKDVEAIYLRSIYEYEAHPSFDRYIFDLDLDEAFPGATANLLQKVQFAIKFEAGEDVYWDNHR
ncbi:protein phosphatase 1, regulatory subunit [Quaeritorhiza haematococci]|nr:protein phosphatase 1, regulatory subunit [Quaeritorhiza haematococci]